MKTEDTMISQEYKDKFLETFRAFEALMEFEKPGQEVPIMWRVTKCLTSFFEDEAVFGQEVEWHPVLTPVTDEEWVPDPPDGFEKASKTYHDLVDQLAQFAEHEHLPHKSYDRLLFNLDFEDYFKIMASEMRKSLNRREKVLRDTLSRITAEARDIENQLAEMKETK